MTEPPFEAGVKATVNCVFPSVISMPVGALGTVAGVPDAELESTLSPIRLCARMTTV